MTDPIAKNTLMTKYMPLAKEVQQWPPGLKDMKKYNIEPYLIEHQAFSNDVHKYKQLWEEHKAQPNNATITTAAQQQKKKCVASGAKFQGSIPNLKSTAQKLAVQLGNDSRDPGVTQAQKDAVIALLKFIKEMQASFSKDWAQFNVVEGMLQKIESGGAVQ